MGPSTKMNENDQNYENNSTIQVLLFTLGFLTELDVQICFNGVFFSTKKCAFYEKKMQFCVCFLKMFRPLKG